MPSQGTLPETAYSNAFVGGSPRDGVSRAQARISKAKAFADEMAEYFCVRRELESAYVRNLQKIARRSFLSDPSALPPDFRPVFERLISELAEVAEIHGALGKNIESECEVPMRNAPNRGEWARQREHDESMSATLKDISNLEVQLAKDQKKVDSASAKKLLAAQAKAEESRSALSNTMDAWATEAPFFFDAYQRIDSSRLELLKETVIKFATLRSDAAQRLAQTTEQTMQAALSFDPQLDIEDFLLKNATVTDPGERLAHRDSLRITRDSSPKVSNSGRRTTSSLPPLQNDSAAAPDTSPLVTHAPGPSGAGPIASSSASVHSERAPSLFQATGRAPGTLKSTLSRFGKSRASKAPQESPSSYGNLVETDESVTNTVGSESSPALSAYPGSASVPRTTKGDEPVALGADGLITPLTPGKARPKGEDTRTAMAASSAPSPPCLEPDNVDVQGLSIPAQERKPPESDALSPSPSGHQDSDADTNKQRQVSTLIISDGPVVQNSTEDEAALEKVRSTLSAAAPARRATTRRERRDVRNTTYGPLKNLDDESAAAGTRPLSPIGLPVGAGPGSFAASSMSDSPSGGFHPALGNTSERTHSIMSASSGIHGAAATANPFEESVSSKPGLHASIVETVNVLLKDRDISRIMVVGEVSVSFRGVASSGSPVYLRLDSFEQLEKAAPNPALLKPLGVDRPGEYALDVATLLSRGSPANAPAQVRFGQATLLKYQIYVSESRRRDFLPLEVSAQWRCEPNQTSLLLTYAANHESKMAAREGPPRLEGLHFVTSAQSSVVTGVMSKPTGIWSSEGKRLAWTLDECLELGGDTSASSERRKILARFQVEGTATPQPVYVQFRVPGHTLSSLGLSVVGDSSEATSSLSFDSITRRTVAGKYIAGP